MGLDTVELVMAIEEEFGLEIPDSQAEKMQQVGELHAFLVSTLQSRSTAVPVDDVIVWTRLKDVIVEQLGGRAEEVTPSAHFIDDLRAD